MTARASFLSAVDAVLNPDFTLLSETVVPGSPFINRGVLTRPGLGEGVNAYGISWSFTFIPPELGVADGQVPVWNDRLCQFASFSLIGTALYVDEIIDVHHDPGFWIPRHHFPHQITYSLWPGVEAQFRWLLYLLP